MSKKIFEEPQCEVITFLTEDILSSSVEQVTESWEIGEIK